MCSEARVPVIDNQATHKKKENHTKDLRDSAEYLGPWPKRTHSYSSTLGQGLQII